ncbi:MAG: hypothetical protein ABI041_00905 [Bdellovibrionia bacterium]
MDATALWNLKDLDADHHFSAVLRDCTWVLAMQRNFPSIRRYAARSTSLSF